MSPALASLSVPEFQARWRNTQLSERAAAQPHFMDLCALVGFPTPTAMDKAGANYVFERRVRKLDGTVGFADVWHRHHFAWEYKRRGADLDKAYQQILYYREDLENPPLLVVTDIERTEVHTNFTNSAKQVYAFTLDQLAEPKCLDTLRKVFHDPKALRPGETVETVTKLAAARFADLAAALERRGNDPRRVAHFLVQILFCLFAEDVGLLPNGLFTKMLTYCATRPGAFPEKAAELFRAMQVGGEVAYEVIARFNGGIFATVDVLPLTAEELAELVRAAELHWGSVEPAIFGTLFERSLDPDQRRKLGAHYTSRADIERVVDPVVMAPLRRRWEGVKAQADELQRHWQAAPNRSEATKRQNAFRRVLTDFQQELSRLTILDPACGSGNFLYVALAAVHDLEMEVSRYGANSGLSYMLPMVTPTQLFGLELNPYARELAQVVVWIGHLQWMQAHGFPFKMDPVIDSIETIEIRDALICDAAGHASEAVWPQADYIIGNPPFLGAKKLRSELDDEYVETLFSVYRDRVPGMSDLVCYFFEKARGQIAAGHTKRAGLLATNSIRGGASRRVLERIKESGDIFMAWDDEPWILDGAAVRISIVGFDDGTEPTRCLNDQPVGTINSDLTALIDVSVAQRLQQNSGIGFVGDVKAGKFDIPGALARQWLALPSNPNGRANDDVLRPWVNSLDILRRNRDMWIVDFGIDMSEREAALYEAPFEHVRAVVKPERDKVKRSRYRNYWWLHAEPVTGMRRAVETLPRYLVTPTVAKHRVFAWLSGRVLADHQLIVFGRADDYFFGVLHSRAHEVWSLRMGTSLEDRPRYTPTTCFETFPFPWVPGQEDWQDPNNHAIAHAAIELNNLRERWLNPPDAEEAELKKRTLTNLYNQRPAWLQQAHNALDRAVWAAYGWEDTDPAVVAEDVILGRLLALNLSRSSVESSQQLASSVDQVISIESGHQPPNGYKPPREELDPEPYVLNVIGELVPALESSASG